MARIEEKSKNSKKLLGKTLTWIAVGFLAAVLVASIVILVLWLVGKDDENNNEFVEKFETAEIITFAELELMLDNDQTSELLDGKAGVYVYVYTPDYEANEVASNLHDKVLEAVNAYNEVKAGESEYAFYVINVTDEDNIDYISENPSSFVSGLGTSYPYLVKFEEEQKTVTGYNKINAALKDIINNLTPEK